MTDAALVCLAKREMEQLSLAKANEVVEACVVRVEKAYPRYDADYQKNVDVIRQSMSQIKNLQMVGRNGMHKYNNQDHSMLTGMFAAENLAGANRDVWRVNTDAEYLEEGRESGKRGRLIPEMIGKHCNTHQRVD